MGSELACMASPSAPDISRLICLLIPNSPIAGHTGNEAGQGDCSVATV